MKTTKERIPGGRLWLADRPEADIVRRFVRNGKIPPEARVLHRSSRCTVRLVDVQGVGRCILKEAGVIRGRGLGHRLESAFKLHFVHRALRTMRLAGRFLDSGIRTFEPLAFWTDSRGGIRNFLLYRHVDGEIVGDYWMGELASISPTAKGAKPPPEEALLSFFSKAGELVRDLHEAGFIHTDLHPKNFVSPDAMSGAGPLALIDLDSARVPFAPGRRCLFTVRMRSFRRLAQCFRSEDDPGLRAFVRSYSRGDPETEEAVLRALRFWRGRPQRSTLDRIRAWWRCPPPRPVAARGRRAFDLVFSIGWDCKCSGALRRAGLQHFSYPFDWIVGAPPETRARIMADDFRGWFELSDLEDIGPAPFNRFASVKRIARHRSSQLEFRHDFPLELSLEEGYPEASAKYGRRTRRLLDALEKSERPLAVFCDGYGCRPATLAQLEETRAILAARFGDKIELLGIFDDRPGMPHEAAEAISADGRTRRWSLPCEERTPGGIEVRASVVARFLAARISCPDPHTPAERRERRRAERRAAYGKYKASSWFGMMRNKMLFRRYRRLGKILQKKGIIPSNRPGLR